MADHQCEACASRPAPNSTICRPCTDHLVSEVASVGAYHGLAYDLDIAIAKQAKLRPAPGGRSFSGDRPLLIDERASDAGCALRKAMSRWARVIVDETGADQPRDSLPALAAWLRPRVRWVTHHPDAAEAYSEICGAIRAARIAVDRPDDRVYAGPCDCGRSLYARPDSRWAVCRAEEHDVPLMWPVDERRKWLMDQAVDFVGTTAQVAMALSRYYTPVTPAAIRGMVFRRKLRPCWADDRRRAMFRVGDVIEAMNPPVTSEKAVS